MADPRILIAFGCWGVVLLVWVVRAIVDRRRAPREAVRMDADRRLVAGAVVLSALILIAGRGLGEHYLSFGPEWSRDLGLVVLIASMALALWARTSLGTAWSLDARAGGGNELRTTGPYAVTRHPIYTGLLGMLIGSTLVAGVGQWIVLVAMGLVVVELRITIEERLLRSTFPDAYARYSRSVPQLIPGLRLPTLRSS